MSEHKAWQPLLAFLEGAIGSPYVYGGTGRPCTVDYRQARMRQYPAYAAAISRACPRLSGRASSCARCPYRNKNVYDCAQLVKAALGSVGTKLVSGASSQWKMPGAWAWRGPIDDLAKRHVCVLFRAASPADRARPMTHVGISLGNGWVVDARNHQQGVMKSKITAYPWTHMAFPTGLPVPAGLGAQTDGLPQPAQTAGKQGLAMGQMSLQVGQQGYEVREMQLQLLKLGYKLPRWRADGKYGLETAGAVRAFQHVTGLAPTGQADLATMARLFPVAPAFVPMEDEEEDLGIPEDPDVLELFDFKESELDVG